MGRYRWPCGATSPNPRPHDQLTRIIASVGDPDPYGLDLQLALYMCYELHYRGFAGVDPTWEWNPGLLHLRDNWSAYFWPGCVAMWARSNPAAPPKPK